MLDQLATPERVRARGRVLYSLLDANTRKIIQRGQSRNIITRTGLGLWDTALLTSPPNLIDTCKVGTGLTVPADTDTVLTTTLTSKDITSIITTFVTGATPYVIVRTQFDEDEAIGSLTETGLFFDNAVMFNHAFFGSGVITGATQANPCVITDADHGLTSGQRVIIEAVGGMTQLNSNLYYVSVLSSSTFSLYSDSTLTTAINSTGYGAYTSGGTWKISIPKTSATILVVRIELQLSNA